MVTKTEKPEDGQGASGPDHVESLDSIAKLGAQMETPGAAPGAPGAPGKLAAATKEAEQVEICAALELLRAAALPFAPAHVQEPLAAVWNDRQLEKIAASIVEICHLHGWTTGDFFDKYGPYLQLGMALGLPALATLKLLKMPPPQAADDGQQQQA
jgi:hypothetical protein